ncbi:MAG: DNRLRE domain-containing protein [Gemmatimonadota bacterium]
MSLIRFDVGALAAPPLAAILELTPTETAGDTSVIVFHDVLAPWEEGTVTWTTVPDLGGKIGAQFGTGLLSTCEPTCEADLTFKVAEWMLGVSENGLALRQDGVLGGTSSNIAYHTRHSADPAVRPKLRISPDTHFAGPAARAAFDALGGTAYDSAKVPVNAFYSPDRPGVADGHWRGNVFLHEVMEANLGASLNSVTIGAMADIGYEVDPSVADPAELRTHSFQELSCEPIAPIDGNGGPLYRVGPRGSFELLSPRTRVPASADPDGTRRP